jgi:predicted Zn-ribbon and HTH transcriptional regulator
MLRRGGRKFMRAFEDNFPFRHPLRIRRLSACHYGRSGTNSNPNMGYCHTHGSYSGDGCSECRDAEELAAADRAEMLEKLAEAAEAQSEAHEQLAYAINNPGKYACPYCKLRTLLSGASRCPRCQKDVEPAFWVTVLDREEKARQRNEKERQHYEEEQRRRNLERMHSERDAKRRSVCWSFMVFYFGYLLPVLCVWSIVLCGQVHIVENPRENAITIGNAVGIFIPILNWMALVAELFSHTHLVLPWLVLWTAAAIGGLFLRLRPVYGSSR